MLGLLWAWVLALLVVGLYLLVAAGGAALVGALVGFAVGQLQSAGKKPTVTP